MDKNTKHIHNLIEIHQRRLQELQKREAQMGVNTPPDIILEIEDIKTKIERLKANGSELTDSLSGRHLIGHSDVYSTINRLCATTQKRIRALLHLLTPQFSAPPEWPTTVARRLRELNDLGRPARLDAVIACNFDNLPSNFREQMETRMSIYKEYGVENLTARYLLNSPQLLGFDIFIIDRDHAVIAFRSIAGMRAVNNAILFENQAEIVSDLADWFDHFVREPTTSYENWLSQNKA